MSMWVMGILEMEYMQRCHGECVCMGGGVVGVTGCVSGSVGGCCGAVFWSQRERESPGNFSSALPLDLLATALV